MNNNYNVFLQNIFKFLKNSVKFLLDLMKNYLQKQVIQQ
jgi:hypothetical protein